MTEPTTNEALVEELARAICYRSVHWGDAEGVVKSRVDAEWKAYIGDAQDILPIITRRDQETWNRAIEAAEAVIRLLAIAYPSEPGTPGDVKSSLGAAARVGLDSAADAIASLKDNPQ